MKAERQVPLLSSRLSQSTAAAEKTQGRSLNGAFSKNTTLNSQAIDAPRAEVKISVIVPTLNEEAYLGKLLRSLYAQEVQPFEIIVVDGGSTDRTVEIAQQFGAHTIRRKGMKEFPSLNLGADVARGSILLFTGADTILPRRVLGNVSSRFLQDSELVALGGPGIPIRPPFVFDLEFGVYNALRYAASRLPPKWKRFSASTNLLAVRTRAFREVGGLGTDQINADGLLASALSQSGKVHFSYRKIRCYMADRRMRQMGFLAFNLHYLYVLENFFPWLSRVSLMHKLKERSGNNHSRQNARSSWFGNG